MKLAFVVFVSGLALLAADPQSETKKTAQTPKASAKTAPKITDASKLATIPPDAVRNADGDYRYTDPEGKKWIYRRTPFGIAKLADTSELPPAKVAEASGIQATEDGDNVHFERKGPFGIWKWDKKKSELDETEKAALQNSQANNKTASKQD